ncbi:UNVERIFIED_CONTAM: hypothetical protein FKN15_039857 [Acipenser sinensis]
MLWYLFTHSTLDSLRVTAISALCRITRHSASTFQSVIDKVGLPAILNSLVSGISRIQQYMLTMFTEMLSSGVHLQRLVQEKNHIKSIDSSETSLDSAVGQAASGELIRTTLSAIEAVTQHPALLMQYHSTVVDSILPPMVSLAFSKNVEWRIYSLRLLSETTLMLVNHEAMEKGERLNSNSKLLTLIRVPASTI